MKRTGLTLLFFLLSVTIAKAQTNPVCPADILLDVARAASTCFRLEREVICSGNGAVTATGFDGEPVISHPGDRVDAARVASLSVTSSPDELGAALLSLRGNLPSLTERSVTLVAFGDVSLVNKVLPLPQLTATATGAANLRSAPQADAAIVGQAAVSTGLILNGRTNDSRWLRAQVRNTDTYGWVSADVLNIPGSVLDLAVADEHSLVQRAFETLSLSIQDTALCGDALHSGLLLQTPSVDQPVTFDIDTLPFSLAGTAYISDSAGPEIYVLQGHVVLGEDQFIPAGAWLTPTQSVLPFDPTVLSALPLSMLPVSVRLNAPITEVDIRQLTQEFVAARAAEMAQPTPPPTPDLSLCRRVTRRAATLYAGPGSFYEVINDISAGQSVTPVLQATDPDGQRWWQLGSSNWILATEVHETGECLPVPQAQVIPVPDKNTLALETCETTNGPLRAGQRVTIQFTPPPWDNYGEARDAVIVDPGRISIGRRTYRTDATNPIQIGTVGVDDRYLRRFYVVWIAEPGTFRIVGDRLSYEPICTLTVPVGF